MEQVSGYKLIEHIGEGGMATVHKGIQISLKRLVAIKILLKKLTDHSEVLDRFNRESIIIARLNHPNIIHIIDRGITTEGMPYFAMEYVEGTDLETAIDSKSLDYNRKLDLVIQICRALSYAHKNGVIHRDIKPSNVLIDKNGNALVLDFGIAQFYDNNNKDYHYTQDGIIMGTPEYMSPEQLDSSCNVTASSDLYSLGVVMYKLFTGVKPAGRFRLPAELDPDFSEHLQDIIISCLDPDPSNRPSSADEVKDRLLKLLNGAHLKENQKNRAIQGISSIDEKFALLDVIKEKPFGSVYLYEDRINKKLLVIKKRPSTSAGFIEAKMLTSLRHKNIAAILGSSKNDNYFIVVMEYLSGGSLKDRLAQTWPIDRFLTIARQICEGLSFAHMNRIIHGDLRPSNILLSDTENIKITDFGLDEHYLGKKEKNNWFNPFGEKKSFQADIFAAGVIFYQMLTGSMPVWNDHSLSSCNSFELLPSELQKMVTRMLARYHGKRYISFEEVLKAIESLASVSVKGMVPEILTEIIVDKTEPLPSPQPVKQLSLPRRNTTFLLLILFCVSVAAYLVHTIGIDNYIKMLLNFFDRLF